MDAKPLEYQRADASPDDVSHLQILTICHYVWGGLVMVFSCIFIFHIVIGIMMINGRTNMPPGPEPVGYIMVGMGSCAILLGWAIGILTITSGRKMAARRSRLFSLTIAGINCISFPIGTALGVFTIIVLSRNSVKALYETRG